MAIGLMLASSSSSSTLSEQKKLPQPSRERFLEVLRELYGKELAPVLHAIAGVESNFDVLAHSSTDTEDSHGPWQVNTLAWGADAGPLSVDVAGNLDRLLQWQARAMRPVVDDAIAGAREIQASAGAPFASAFNLVWQYGRTSARRIVRGITWSQQAVASRIAELYDDAKAEAWRIRNAAFDSFLRGAIAVLVPAAAGSATFLFVILLLWTFYRRGFK